jgi:hypothetical protein
MPILAAVVGVLGGMGGAFIGGYVANEGQERRFEREQDVRREELRRTAYADFLLAAATVNQGGVGSEDERLARADSAEAMVRLFADAATREAASVLSDAVWERGPCIERIRRAFPSQQDQLNDAQLEEWAIMERQKCYRKAQEDFVVAAKAQIEAGN